MSLAQGNKHTDPAEDRLEPGSPDPESDALTIRPVRPQSQIMIKQTFGREMERTPSYMQIKEVTILGVYWDYIFLRFYDYGIKFKKLFYFQVIAKLMPILC